MKNKNYKREPVNATTLEVGILEAEVMSLQEKLATKTAALEELTQWVKTTEEARQNWQREALKLRNRLPVWKLSTLLLALALVASLMLR